MKKGFLHDEIADEGGWSLNTAGRIFYGQKGYILARLLEEGNARLARYPKETLKKEGKVLVQAVVMQGKTVNHTSTITGVVSQVLDENEERVYMSTRKNAEIFYYEVDDLGIAHGCRGKKGFLYREIISKDGWYDARYSILSGNKGHVLDRLCEEGNARLCDDPGKSISEERTVVMTIVKRGRPLWDSSTETVCVHKIMSEEEQAEYIGKKDARLHYYEVDDIGEAHGCNDDTIPEEQYVFSPD